MSEVPDFTLILAGEYIFFELFSLEGGGGGGGGGNW